MFNTINNDYVLWIMYWLILKVLTRNLYFSIWKREKKSEEFAKIFLFNEVCYSSFYYAIVNCYFWSYDVKIDFNFKKTFFDNQFTHF